MQNILEHWHFKLLSKPQPNLNTVGFDNIMTVHHPPHPTPQKLSVSNISAVTDRFGWNFTGRFLWTFRTESNCQCDICPCNICPRDILCPYQEYLSCYWPDFDETLKVGSWEHLEQIPTVTVTFSRQHLFWWHLYISGISQLLLTQFGLNFKGKVKAKSMQGWGKVRERSRQG